MGLLPKVLLGRSGAPLRFVCRGEKQNIPISRQSRASLVLREVTPFKDAAPHRPSMCPDQESPDLPGGGCDAEGLGAGARTQRSKGRLLPSSPPSSKFAGTLPAKNLGQKPTKEGNGRLAWAVIALTARCVIALLAAATTQRKRLCRRFRWRNRPV
jgi:hypothetical protein